MIFFWNRTEIELTGWFNVTNKTNEKATLVLFPEPPEEKKEEEKKEESVMPKLGGFGLSKLGTGLLSVFGKGEPEEDAPKRRK